jgi:hypothetical protein
MPLIRIRTEEKNLTNKFEKYRQNHEVTSIAVFSNSYHIHAANITVVSVNFALEHVETCRRVRGNLTSYFLDDIRQHYKGTIYNHFRTCSESFFTVKICYAQRILQLLRLSIKT